MDDPLIAATFRELPCLSCENWRRDRALAKLAWFYLSHERGDRPQPPSRQEILRGCCKHGEHADGRVVAFAFPPTPARRS